MKKISLMAILIFFSLFGHSQGWSLSSFSLPKEDKGKPVKYNAFGMGVLPHDQLMAGGNHVSYRKFGFGISWRLGIENFLHNKETFSEVIFDTAASNNWLTGKTENYYSFGANFNFVFAITKKIPAYVGIGTVKRRQFAELQTPFTKPRETEWVMNTRENKFLLNFGAGVFIPIAGRLVLNLGYDHLPQTLFVGIAISGPFIYEDLDMW